MGPKSMLRCARRGRIATALLAAAITAGVPALCLPKAPTAASAAASTAPPLLNGWYTHLTNSTSRFSTYSSSGARLVTIYWAAGWGTGFLKNTLAGLRRTQVRALVQIDARWVRSSDFTDINAFVDELKANPAVYGWYLYDEPEANGVQPSILQAALADIKSRDPSHPIAVAFTRRSCSSIGADYMSIPDIVMFDRYPVWSQAEYQRTANGRYGISDIAAVADDCVSFLSTHHSAGYQGFVLILQAFNQSPFYPSDVGDRSPTYGEMRYMYYRSLIQDVLGVQWWCDFEADPVTTQFANRLMSETATLPAAVATGAFDDRSVSSSNPAVHWKYGASSIYRYLIAVNDAASQQTGVTLTLPSGVSAKSASVLNDGYTPARGAYQPRTIPLMKGTDGRYSLTDDFPPYGVHVYRVMSLSLPGA